MPRTDTVNAENAHTPSHRERDGQARGYAIILGLLIVSYGFCAAQPSTDPSPWAFLAMLATVAMVFYVTRARHLVQRVWWVVLSVAGAAAVIAALFGVDGPVLAIPLSAASMLALLVAPWAIIAHQVNRRGLDLEALLAAITAYILVGMFFAFVYNLISQISPTPMFGEESLDSLGNQLFFSFTALTTTGYGNLVPVGTTGQGIAIAEGITGQLFLITAVARIMRGASGKGRSSTPA
ncbi:potassium channel family protein [Microbacterium sp.]|uniref:potassium channel family protein n=1 Tax=Microbacterium sp. TaxID=51671 RepID=UPI00262E4FB8|nr:potassium channel family protein [Microbacterium sp.]MCV0335358.1 potassium channel family protein [Microbacterium sp.]MCV0375896.1 potassium channel family protein [Microbacterium sp.]MCV0390152.1 potassium channel family protein [Microbacterium sp.]MCV0417887.1 potassium channel family protein [Microbacterium sp.]MCV0422445.1 potassium channel family protein [Microbacterium sp.]